MKFDFQICLSQRRARRREAERNIASHESQFAVQATHTCSMALGRNTPSTSVVGYPRDTRAWRARCRRILPNSALTIERFRDCMANMRAVRAFVMSAVACVMACSSGRSRVPPPAAPQAKAEPSRVPVAQEPSANSHLALEEHKAQLPRNCGGDSKSCYPPGEFVRALCGKKYPSVALNIFEKHAPWRHGYVKVKSVAPANAYGGPTGQTFLEFLEEVVLLREREVKQRQVVQDLPLNFDVLRLDGTCATLAEDEFMTKKPVVRPHYAPLIWYQLEAGIRQALSQNPKVQVAADAQANACRGSFLAGGGEPCRDSTQELARSIIAALDEGLELPAPVVLPDWSNGSSASNALDPRCKIRGNC